MKVDFLDLKAQYASIKNEIDEAIANVLRDTAFSSGPYVKQFEKEFAAALGAKYCIAVNSGTAALHVAFVALGIGPGDEVIVPANTFFATPEAVSLTGATPVFVDCNPDRYCIEPDLIEGAITSRTRAIVAVNLYGQAAELDKIKAIADKYCLPLVEDCAQSHLASLAGKMTGTYGKVGCFSFYCSKNLGAYGDGGAVVTDDYDVYQTCLKYRDHGSAQKYHHDMIGHNYRLAGFQGAILSVKLKHLEEWTKARRQHAAYYNKLLSDIGMPAGVRCPSEVSDARHVYHLYVIEVDDRDALAAFLAKEGISTGIHYPIPCHLQKAYESLGYEIGSMPVAECGANRILSLPMYAELTDAQIEFVAAKIKEFYSISN